jgi:pre-mRNA-splicing factor ATP-dependent RNA helicase DHX15/PRP43
VYNSYNQSNLSSFYTQTHSHLPPDSYDENWTRNNYLSARVLMEADNVREQLKRTMEQFEVELISVQDQKKMFMAIRQALCTGFFMQVAHKEGDKGNYMTVKDNQARYFYRGLVY